MTKVYLHVGMPKCASSTIQGYFHRFDRRNAKAGFVYPLAGRSQRGYFSHAPIVGMNPDEVADVVTRIADEAKGAERVFISSEQFVNAYWDRPVTGELIRQLNATFGAENVRLVFLFRNHYSFIESGFAQFLKAGLYRVEHGEFFARSTGDVEGFCNHFRDTNGFDFFDYSHVIEEFREQCDPENGIEVYSIERDDLATGDILEELCTKYSLVPPARKNVKNARFPAKALLGLAYGIKHKGFENIHPARRDIAARFADAADGFSPLLHVHGHFADAVAARQRADAHYFRNVLRVTYPALFGPQRHPVPSADRHGEMRLTDADRAWIDGHFTGG